MVKRWIGLNPHRTKLMIVVHIGVGRAAALSLPKSLLSRFNMQAPLLARNYFSGKKHTRMLPINNDAGMVSRAI